MTPTSTTRNPIDALELVRFCASPFGFLRLRDGRGEVETLEHALSLVAAGSP